MLRSCQNKLEYQGCPGHSLIAAICNSFTSMSAQGATLVQTRDHTQPLTSQSHYPREVLRIGMFKGFSYGRTEPAGEKYIA